MSENSGLNNMKKKWSLKSRPLKTFAGVSLLFADEGDAILVEGEVIWVNPPKAEGKALVAQVRTADSTIEVRILHPTALHRRSFVRGALVRLREKTDPLAWAAVSGSSQNRITRISP